MENYQELHIEQDFWADFILEAFEHIDEIETNAMSLEQNPEDVDLIHTMFRAFHTIKGLSGFVEHTIIQEIAHKTETMMDYCRKGELSVNTAIVNAILKASDYIKTLCNDVDSYKNPELIQNIQTLLETLEELSEVEPKNNKTSLEKKEEEIPVEEIQKVEEINKEEGLEAFANDDAFKVFEEVNESIEELPLEKEEDQTPIQKEEQVEEVEQKKEEVSVEESQQIEESVEKVQEQEEEPLKEELTEEKPEDISSEVKEEVVQPEKTVEKVESNNFQNQIMEKSKIDTPKPAVEQSREVASPKVVSANEEHMKVANYKIDHLVDMIGELIISESLIEQYVASNYSDDRQLNANMSGFLRITTELQNLSMSLRMVSLKPTFQKISRIARDTIQELNKNVEFIVTGESTEIDRVVADKLLDPLVHLIKNAISHGVEETPEDRVKINKNPRAKVELSAYNKRGKIFIEVKDDGRGINTEIVYQKALEKGLIDQSKTYSDAEIKEFIMLPGFSTAKVVDNISGRGVGMDVVKTQILKIGGKVDIQSNLNKGSTFTLEVPVNNAIMNGTIIEFLDQQFVVPTINVKEFLKPSKEQWIFTKQKRTMIRVRDNIIPIIPATTFAKDAQEQEDAPLVMLLELEQELRALPIVNVINRQEVVVKPLSEEFSHLKFISGMSILGTGRVSLILDIDYLFRKEIKE